MTVPAIDPKVTPTTPTVPPAPSPTITPDPKGSEFKVPEQYAKEPWAAGLKTIEDVFTQMANAQTLIGKKELYIPPPESATPEIKKAFQKALGIPETPEGYEFQVIEPLKDLKRDPTIDAKVKAELHKNGVPKSAGENIIKTLEMMVYETNKPRIEAQTKLEKDFSALKLATFGEKAETAQAQFKEVMLTTLKGQEHLTAKLNELSPEAVTTVIAFAKAIHDKYVGEHKITPAGPGSGSGSSPDLKTAYTELSAAKLVVKNDKNIPQHVKSQRLQELNTKMQEIGRKANESGINLFA